MKPLNNIRNCWVCLKEFNLGGGFLTIGCQDSGYDTLCIAWSPDTYIPFCLTSNIIGCPDSEYGTLGVVGVHGSYIRFVISNP